MNFDEIKSLDNQYLMPTYGRFDVAITEGYGTIAVSPEGKRYIDFTSGIGVNSLGYCDKDWAKAVADQAAKLNHTSNLYYTEPATKLAEKLCGLTDMSSSFLCNSGAEANECAIKLVRKYSYDKYGEGRNTIVSLVNSFHGRTMATLSATGQDSFHEFFHPFIANHEYLKCNNINAIDDALHKGVCAVMIELVQGEGGVNAVSAEFVARLREVTLKRDIILIVDEVQTGISRTGRFIACEHYGLKPDVITLAKGLGGGLPIGACLASSKLNNVLGKGNHGSTFGGNPIVCAGALVVLEKASDYYFLMKVQSNGRAIADYMSKVKNVISVSGLGMMVGIELDKITALEVAKKAAEQGLLVLTAKTKLRLLPPLTTDLGEILEGLKILKRIIEMA